MTLCIAVEKEKNDHAYSSRQVRLIVKFLDEP